MPGCRSTPQRGFTLIELLVAMAVMALLALLSWRSIDGMRRAHDLTRERANEVLRLQAALGQWNADLDAVVDTGELAAIQFDGRVLRMTRRDSAERGIDSPGIRVVAWTRMAATDGATGAQWMRWQSPPLRQRDELARAWERASRWGRDERQSDDAQTDDSAIALAGIDSWQLFFHRGQTWGNPQSSVGNESIQPSDISGQRPNGVRLVLTLSAGHGLAGPLVSDWVSPTLTAGS